MSPPVFFPDVDESALAVLPATTLSCLRDLLARELPSNVVPERTWWRGEGSRGGDFVIPHRVFDGLAVMVRVGEVSARAQVAYTTYRRPDRGDEFDEATNAKRASWVATIDNGPSFCGELGRVVCEYLSRELCIVGESSRADHEFHPTSVEWRSLRNDTRDSLVLWRRPRRKLRFPGAHATSTTSFA